MACARGAWRGWPRQPPFIKNVLCLGFAWTWGKITSVQPDQSEVENSEDPVRELIRLMEKTILHEEGMEAGAPIMAPNGTHILNDRHLEKFVPTNAQSPVRLGRTWGDFTLEKEWRAERGISRSNFHDLYKRWHWGRSQHNIINKTCEIWILRVAIEAGKFILCSSIMPGALGVSFPLVFVRWMNTYQTA